jgi:hypothetical protein
VLILLSSQNRVAVLSPSPRTFAVCMSSCYLCSETFNLPVSLPCGHVFCSQCILISVQTVKPLTPLHRCPTCGSWYDITLFDTKTVPIPLRPFVPPSVRPLHMDVMRSDSKTEPTRMSNSSWAFETSAVRSSSVSYPAPGPSDDKVSSEMARLRAENNALRNHCFMWRKRAEVHGEANLNLLKFARAIRDQASQIARDRNELENRCLMLKQQLDGENTYSDEMQKYGQSSRSAAVEPDLDLRKQMGEDRSHRSVSSLPLRLPANSLARLDSDQSRKRPRVSGDGNRE